MSRNKANKLLLLLGGTSQARMLCDKLSQGGYAVIYSLAGRTEQPLHPKYANAIRSGGFGGILGLTAFLKRNHISAVIDATHPFAQKMSNNAVAATNSLNLPLMRLEREQWPEPKAAQNPTWSLFDDQTALITAMESLPASRIFLALGSAKVLDFFALKQHHFLLRSVQPLATALPDNAQNILARGPFDYEQEQELLRAHNIDLLVAKNAGGMEGYNKIKAAYALNIPCWLIAAPKLLPAKTCTQTREILDWLKAAL